AAPTDRSSSDGDGSCFVVGGVLDVAFPALVALPLPVSFGFSVPTGADVVEDGPPDLPPPFTACGLTNRSAPGAPEACFTGSTSAVVSSTSSSTDNSADAG